MNKIQILVNTSKHGKPWQFAVNKGTGGKNALRKDAVRGYGYVERKLNRLLGTDRGVKIVVKVNYYIGTNEGDYFTSKEALYALLCFLEDYLPEDFQRDRFEKYKPE